MVERPHTGPLPPVHPDPYGPPPQPDGDRVPQRSAPPAPATRRERLLAAVLVGIVLAAMLIGALR